MVVSLPDPDGSEIVQWIDVAGVPSGWTLSDAGASVVFDGFDWKVIAGNVAHGGRSIFRSRRLPNLWNPEGLTVTAHVVDTGNGSQNQSIPVTFNVTGDRRNPGAWKHYGRHDHARQQQRQLRDL